MKPELLKQIAVYLVLFGGINWGLIGLLRVDIVALIFGSSILARLVYILIGVSAGYLIYLIYAKKLNF